MLYIYYIKDPDIFSDRLKWFLYIRCAVRNQPENVLKEILKIISDMVYIIYLKSVSISELLTMIGLIITQNTNQSLSLH